MKVSPRLLLFSFIFLLCAQPCLSQRAGKRIQPTQFKLDSKPFNKEVESLPPNYIGNSYIEILVALSKQQKVAFKGEFESTIDYRARIERLNSQPLTGAITRNSLLAFAFMPDDQQLTVKYDADLTVLDTHLKWDRSYANGALYTLKWSDSSQRVATYIGRNAFGIQKRIQVYRNADYYLGTNIRGDSMLRKLDDRADAGRSRRSPSSLPYDNQIPPTSEPSFIGSIFMPPSEARIAKGNLRALVVCRLAETPFYQDQDHDTPEITDPYDRYNFTYTLIVLPEEIWFYDLPSGRVYAKLSYESGRSAEEESAEDSSLEYSNRIFKENEVNMRARILSRPQPLYTAEAREKGITGKVVLRAVFTSDGKVTNIRTISGLPFGLTERAMEAARQIRFSPALKDGRPVSQYTQIEYEFNSY
jgi:TonB family protein